MTVTFRCLERCDRCKSPLRTRCDELRASLSRVVVEHAEAAAKDHCKTLDADLVLDCKSFDRHGRPRTK